MRLARLCATPTQFPTIRRCMVPSWERSLQASLEAFLTKRAAPYAIGQFQSWEGTRVGRVTARVGSSGELPDHEILCAPGIQERPARQTPSRMGRAALATHFP